jgi:hypothetical protein
MDTLDSVQMASITYGADYPRIQKIYWDGDSTETNIEVALTRLEARDMGAGRWNVTVEFTWNVTVEFTERLE